MRVLDSGKKVVGWERTISWLNSLKKPTAYSVPLDNEIIEIEPWGRNGLRVRCTQSGEIQTGLDQCSNQPGDYQAELEIHPNGANIRNGEMKAVISSKGEISFINVNDGKELLKEKPIHFISIPARAYKDLKGGLFHIDCCFEAYDDEHIYGLGTAPTWSVGSKGLRD